jgi:hypothetical protein
MTRKGRDPRRRLKTLTTAGSIGPIQEPQASSRDNLAAWRLVSLAVLGHLLRSRRFQERAVVAAIVLMALAGLGQESQTRIFARLVAWNERQVKRLEREVERQVRQLEPRAH